MIPRVKVIEPNAILDGTHANTMRQEVNDILIEGVDILLIDFSEVKFMDSSGLAALILTFKNIKASGGKMYLCSLSEQVKILLELTKLDQIFNIYPSREEFNRTLLAMQKFAI